MVGNAESYACPTLHFHCPSLTHPAWRARVASWQQKGRLVACPTCGNYLVWVNP